MAFMRNKNFLKHVGAGHCVAGARLTLGGASNPTIVEGSEFISSVTHTGGSNDIVITFKDTIAAVIYAAAEGTGGTAGSDFINPASTLATFIQNEASSTALKVTFNTLQAGGSARNDQTGTVFLFFLVRELNVSTPGGN